MPNFEQNKIFLAHHRSYNVVNNVKIVFLYNFSLNFLNIIMR